MVFGDLLPPTLDDKEEEEEGDGRKVGGMDDILSIAMTTEPLIVDPKKPRRLYLTTTLAYRVVQQYAAAVLYLAIKNTDWYSSELWLEPGVHECNFFGITCKDLPIPAISLEVTLSNCQQIDNTMGGRWGERRPAGAATTRQWDCGLWRALSRC